MSLRGVLLYPFEEPVKLDRGEYWAKKDISGFKGFEKCLSYYRCVNEETLDKLISNQISKPKFIKKDVYEPLNSDSNDSIPVENVISPFSICSCYLSSSNGQQSNGIYFRENATFRITMFSASVRYDLDAFFRDKTFLFVRLMTELHNTDGRISISDFGFESFESKLIAQEGAELRQFDAIVNIASSTLITESC